MWKTSVAICAANLARGPPRGKKTSAELAVYGLNRGGANQASISASNFMALVAMSKYAISLSTPTDA